VGSGASRLAIRNRAPAFFPLAIQREKPIAPLHRDPGKFKPAIAGPVSKKQGRSIGTAMWMRQ
jgi:hypothetical protein